MKYFLLCLFLCLCVNVSYSATIKGKVKDVATGEYLIGASVMISELGKGLIADKKGKYKFENIEKGNYSISAQYIGYKKEIKKIKISKKDDEITIDFSLAEAKITTASVIVEARADKELESSARQSEKNSNTVINVITAESIEHSTDLTSADVLQRISGLSLVRDQGEGKYVVMRGLEQRFNNTLVNGIKIPSPESRDRFVPLDIFPSQLLQRIEITKALTPDMEGDAIGGTTNLIIREASNEPTIYANVSTGYSSFLLDNKFNSFNHKAVNDMDPDRIYGSVSDQNPLLLMKDRAIVTSSNFSTDNLKFTNSQAPIDANASVILGKRFFDNKFGAIAAITYLNNNSGYSENNFTPDNSQINNDYTPVLLTKDDRFYSTNKQRLGIAAKTDYILNETNEFKFTYLYVNQQIAEVRFDTTTNIGYSRGSADITYGFRSALRTQNISNYQFEGNHILTSEFDLRWVVNISDAVQDRPDEAQITIFQNFDQNHQLQSFQGLDNITRSWRKNDDKELLGKFDLNYKPDNNKNFSIKAGASVLNMSRVNYQDDFTLSPVIDPVTKQTQQWKGIDSSVVTPKGAYGNPVFGYQNYTAKETVISGYLQFLYRIESFQILGGLRLEYTSDTYNTMAGYNGVAGLAAAQATVGYADFLPSLHFIYLLNTEQQIRLSTTWTMSRPSYFDLVPAQDRNDIQSTTGNPYLHPAHAFNVDTRYEYYPNPTEVFSVGAYFKKIDGDIEVTYDYSNPNLTVVEKKNMGTAYAAGFELVGAKHIGDFALVANYSYVNTQIKSLKYILTKDANGDPVVPVPSYMQTRQMQAASPNIANASIIYNNKESGTNLQLAYNLTGRRLETVSPDDGMDEYQNTIHELDFSGEQIIFDKFKIYIKLVNLLNAPTEIEIPGGQIKQHETLIIRKDFNKMRGNIGFSYRF